MYLTMSVHDNTQFMQPLSPDDLQSIATTINRFAAIAARTPHGPQFDLLMKVIISGHQILALAYNDLPVTRQSVSQWLADVCSASMPRHGQWESVTYVEQS
jgi:hypothetical protein